MTSIYDYTTIEAEAEGKFQSRGSKFLATAFPMATMSTLEEFIAHSRKVHPKARHHCYGYRIIKDDVLHEYASDDGEPGGSAGRPILGALKSTDVINVGCVVVRYFGGTKLGVPGLIEAYNQSAFDALNTARKVKITRVNQLRFSAPIALLPHLHRHAKQYDLILTNEEYGEQFSFDLEVPMENADSTILKFLAALSARDYPTPEEHLDYLSMKQFTDADS